MSRTIAESSAAYRKRRSQKLARYEAALREIADGAIPNNASDVGEWAIGAHSDLVEIACRALNPETNDD